MATQSPASKIAIQDCELCIVGAGYAALNGLNAAAKYLKKGDRVVVIDKNTTWGGQWNRTYGFVRLHQPYRLFTAGDQPWALKRDLSHLATRQEVLDHLTSVSGVSAGHLEVMPLFAHAYRGHRIRDGHAEIDAAPISNGETRTVRIRARKLLKATGFNMEPLPAFPLSSQRVRSVGPSDPRLMTSEFLDSDAPIYIIGSGKTAMDVVRHVAQSRRAPRPIHILTGSGMWFLIRDNVFPRGPRRYFQGTPPGDVFLRAALMYDGQNERAVFETLERDGLLMNVFGHGGNCRLGVLSFAERDEVRAAVSEIHRGKLVDVEGTRMIVREGVDRREVAVADGSWFINCTSHVRYFPHEPVLQDGGIVCAPQFAMGLSGPAAYYTTHLWYRDELGAVAPALYRTRADIEPKLKVMPARSLCTIANMILTLSRLPPSVASEYEGDLNKWYPIHRQLLLKRRIRTNARDILRKAERLLEGRYSDPAEPALSGPSS
jgi:cation diffusion facilitator CzcD-associated flavoprotein CzcO